MLRATLHAARGENGSSAEPISSSSHVSPPPTWLQSRLVQFLQTVSRRACTHPIHTLAFIAILASTTYLGLLEGTLFEPPPTLHASPDELDLHPFLQGSKVLQTDLRTDWKWQSTEDVPHSTANQNLNHLSLLTLTFPDSIVAGEPVGVPPQSTITSLANSTAHRLPASKNLLSPISQETTLAFSMPFISTAEFISSIQTLPSYTYARDSDTPVSDDDQRWIMTAARFGADGTQRSFRRIVSDAWIAFVDLVKSAEELDIIIMVLGYLSMHLTFISLFISMRSLGSHFWLGTTVLFSSAFSLLFGLLVTTRLGVPLNMVLLSEGLPFLVVIIGFEKPIVLTKAVLSASLALKRPSAGLGNADTPKPTKKGPDSSSHISSSVQIAVREKGYELVRDYAIEVLILVAGAASGVQGGLCQFCFLAAWILFFDCLLLFTFYTSILTIKLEINRIKRHVALRRALEEDGVSRHVAEEVASSNDWPKLSVPEQENAASQESSIFSMKARDSSVSKFKVLMVAGFIAINLLNFFTIPFRSGTRSTGSTLSSAVTQPAMDPFKVAGNGLEMIQLSAKDNDIPTRVTVFSPIRFELEVDGYSHGISRTYSRYVFDMDFADRFMDGVGGRVVDGVLKSFEDPFLSKWIIIALALSLVLNGILFNAARWSIKDSSPQVTDRAAPNQPQNSAVNGAPVLPAINTTQEQPIIRPEAANIYRSDSLHASIQSGNAAKRNLQECEAMIREKMAPLLTDDELVDLAFRGKLPVYALEKTLGDMTRAVKIRRSIISRNPETRDLASGLETSSLPYENYDYDLVHGACCENVVGFLPVPLGLAGPIVVDGKSYHLPMATTEGVLVASTSRGAKAINAGGGAVTVVTGDGMTRGPCVSFSNLTRAGEAKLWLDSEDGQRVMRSAFNSTSRFARLQNLKTQLAGSLLYIRFKTTTGDAMGMNMISKGVEKALDVMRFDAGFDDMTIVSISGNYCVDKKPSAMNWIEGRGKSVSAEAIIPGEVVQRVLKSDVDAMVELNTSKNLIGSAMAGSIGGFNAQASNIVTAMFIATGQDPAQNVESSSCITTMNNHGGSLKISVTLPSIEVGTIGGGTFLHAQSALLDLLGVRGAHPTSPGTNARQLARVVAAGVLAGELSLGAALAAGHLVKAHMEHNRSGAPTRAGTPSIGAGGGNSPRTPGGGSVAGARGLGVEGLTAAA